MRTIVLIFLIFITMLQYRKYRDIICPAVVMNIMWIFSIMGTYLLVPDFDLKIKTGITFIAGAMAFQFGFAASSSGNYEDCSVYEIRPQTLKFLVLVLVPVFAVSLRSLYASMVQNVMYEALRGEGGEVETIGGYFAKIIQYLSILYLILYYRPENEPYKRQIKKYVIILCAMGFITAIMNATRNGMLFYFLPIVVVFLMSNNVPLKKQVKYLVIGLILFLAYYTYISLNKYWWRYASDNFVDVLTRELASYLSGSILAFDNAIDAHAFTSMGENVSRFFLAVSDKLFETNLAPRLVNEFETAYGINTNVFTFYDFYLRDFGIIFAVFMQFVVSCFHGFAYKTKDSAVGLFLLSMLTYSLVMQFFQDQYFALISTWIQILIVLLVMLKTNIFIKKSKVNFV